MTYGNDDERPLVIAPAERGPWGVVVYTGGPRDPVDAPRETLLQADAAIRAGMVALDKVRPRQLYRAEECFWGAFQILTQVLDEPHPRISYVLDRIGLIYHLRGLRELAEALYLRSLESLGPNERPTRWQDVTLINLGSIYRSRGRWYDYAQVQRRFDADGTQPSS
jgi:hypothetical protein